MATKFLETPDATQSTLWWRDITGSVIYDTAQKKSGLASWKCDSGAGDAQAYLERSQTSSPGDQIPDAGGRFSFYVRFTGLPSAARARIVRVTTNTSRYWISIRVTSAGVLQLFTTSQEGSDGSTLSTGTFYRLCLCLDQVSGSTFNVKLFLDGSEDISASSITLGSAYYYGEIIMGWHEAPGANKVLHCHHAYVDDDAGLTDTGDMRVTAKLPDEVNDDNYDATGGTGAVSERPISETNYKVHEGKSAVLQDWTLETAAEGDVDISGDTVVAFCGWMWSKHSKDGDAYYLINNGNTSAAWSDQVVATLNIQTFTGQGYPDHAQGIGQRSGAAAPDDYLYECGTLIAYTVSAIPPTGQPASIRTWGIPTGPGGRSGPGRWFG